jgi:hypothetical protein
VHELSRDQPKTTKELLDNATKHASSEEAVWAVFVQSGGKAAPSGGRGAPTKATDKGDNEKDAGDSNKEFVAAVEHDFKRQAWQPTDHIEKLLEATYPNHMYPVMHKLKECTMIKTT